jgi:hypothetical protein
VKALRLSKLVAVLAVLVSSSTLATGPNPIPTDEPAGNIANWTAPPYWAPAASPENTDRSAREALASGRKALGGGGYAALPFTAVFPCRLVDTRGNGAPLTGGFLPSATVRSYAITGLCGLPPNAQAVSLNATVVKPTGPGFLTLYPEGGAFPPVSTLNYLGGDVIVNAAVVPLGAAGGISMALGVSGGDVILDTNGYYAATPSGSAYASVIGTTLSSSRGFSSVSNPATGVFCLVPTFDWASAKTPPVVTIDYSYSGGILNLAQWRSSGIGCPAGQIAILTFTCTVGASCSPANDAFSIFVP